MDKDVYKALRQSKINRRQSIFNIAIAIVAMACLYKVTTLDDKLNIFKNSDEVSENTKGE